MGLAKAPTVFVSGGSRGIGLAVALRLAKAGANVTIAAKTATPHPKLPGTIYTAVEEIEKAGGKGLPLVVDIRQADQVEEAMAKTVDKFGGLDIVINNASAISLTDSQKTSVKTFDLMSQINGRGTFMVSKFAIPHLLRSAEQGRNPHILSFAPPLEGNLTSEMFAQIGTAYSMAKVAMSLATIGLAGELKGKVAVNALWPYSYISTEAIRLIMSEEGRQKARDPRIMGEASFTMLNKGVDYTGQFEIDEILLRREAGLNSADLAKFANVDFASLQEDLFIPQWVRDQVKALRDADSTTPGT